MVDLSIVILVYQRVSILFVIYSNIKYIQIPFSMFFLSSTLLNNDGFTEVMAASRKVNDFSVAPMLLQSMRQEQAGSNEGDESLIVEEVGDSQPS